MKYIAFITFKHLPHWQKQQLVEAKSAKKAEDIIRRMYKDDILEVIIEEPKEEWADENQNNIS